jgi:hypothetical protein
MPRALFERSRPLQGGDRTSPSQIVFPELPRNKNLSRADERHAGAFYGFR